jgi:hypothetical protein
VCVVSISVIPERMSGRECRMFVFSLVTCSTRMCVFHFLLEPDGLHYSCVVTMVGEKESGLVS